MTHRIPGILIAAFCLLSFFSVQAQSHKHSFALGDSSFMLDGKPLQIISGEMHAERIPRAYWHDRLKMAKAMGLNTIGTYVFWNSHEEVKGHYDFSGNKDIAAFVRAAKEEGLWVVLRPSPYACAEWEFGGYPWWLLKDSTMKVRSKDPHFIAAYKKYIQRLSKELIPLQVTHGGNILMIQIENEYGSYSDDKSYLDLNKQIFRAAGFDGILFTCDGADKMVNGYLPGYLPAVNGEENPEKVKKLIKTYHDGKGPFYVAEWYPGWFDDWGKPHAHSNIENNAKSLDKILSAGISINMYMFHGGTTRGFMNGANMNQTNPYSPQVSSYDYDAPLDEAGNATPKFMKFREVIAMHLPKGKKLPAVPLKKKTISISKIQFSSYAGLFDNLPKAVSSGKPLCFEDLNQPYGFVDYRTILKGSEQGYLRIKELRDYAIIYVNGQRQGMLDRRLKQDSILLIHLPEHAKLDILVENNGRINYGPFLTDNRQGITKSVSLDGTTVSDWKMYGFPFEDLSKLKFSKAAVKAEPVFSKGTFILTQTGDTYLDLRKFGKGFVFLNGINLGKYWDIGPQQTIYIPACWLKKGSNELVVFDALNEGHTEIQTLNTPILGQLNQEGL